MKYCLISYVVSTAGHFWKQIAKLHTEHNAILENKENYLLLDVLS